MYDLAIALLNHPGALARMGEALGDGNACLLECLAGARCWFNAFVSRNRASLEASRAAWPKPASTSKCCTATTTTA